MPVVDPLDRPDVLLYFVDYEQAALVPHPDELPHGERPQVAPIDGTMAGRAFLSNSPLASQREDGWHVWVPVTERAQRLGVLSMTLHEWDERIEYYCVELGYAAAHLLLAAGQYTDLPQVLRRRKGMDLAAEMQWSLLPPLTFRTGGVTVAGLLEPAYEVGGDSFDYAVNLGHLDVAIFDAVGHGLQSAVLASLALGAYRNGRRGAAGLQGLAAGIDGAVRQHPGDQPYLTALLAQLTIDTGRLTWMSCGHPQPLLVRGGATLPDVEVIAGAPLGMGDLASVIGEVMEVALEPGDGVLLYTDGVVESRATDGTPFGEERLRDLLEREHTSGRPPEEVLRRLVASTKAHSRPPLRDDASLVYLRWEGPAGP